MTHKNEKGLKPWLFKSVAVFIGICYLMVPLQHGITEVMHFLSHSLDQGIGHHSMATHSHYFNQQHNQSTVKVQESPNSTEPHVHFGIDTKAADGHHHPHTSKPHEHGIIDFMNMAFSASTANHQDNKKMEVQPDLDKHLVVATYITYQPIPTFKKSYFSNIKENTSNGIHYPIEPPPKPLF